jgi:hypothetical protein
MSTTTQYGPFPVSKGDVPTNIYVQAGDTLNVTATGWVSFARIVGQSFDADGDDWRTPADFPAPSLRDHSLILRVGAGPWRQGGTNKSITVVPGESGEVILRTNDSDQWLWDNDNYWSVWVALVQPDPPPAPPGPPRPALAITGIEVVQHIQASNNGVPLVMGKRTVVRAFVDSGLRSGQDVGAGPDRWPGVTGLLEVRDGRDGSVVASTTAGPMTARAAASIDRAQLDHSLNFALPVAAFLIPLLELHVTAMTTAPGGFVGTATMTQTVTLTQRAQQPILPILVALDNPALNLPAPSMAQFLAALMTGALPRYPVAEDGFVVHPPFFWHTQNDLRSLNEWGLLLQQMATIKLISSTPVDGIRCGVIAHRSPFPLAGIGSPQVWGSWVPTFFADVTDVIAFAHEMGHTFGFGHTMCRGDEGGYDRRNMPGRIEDVGLDVAAGSVVPRGTPDLMSYCRDGNQWCSVAFITEMVKEGVI